MSNIKYIFKKLRTMKFSELSCKAKEIGQKTNKPVFLVVFDMAKSALKYGSGYIDYSELEFYLLNDKERSTYITCKINNDIVDKYNNKEFCGKFNDKFQFYETFKDYLHRDYLDLRTASFKEFKDFINGKDKIVCKSVCSNGTRDVSVVDIDNDKIKNEYNVLKIYNSLNKNEQYLVEDFIKQHNSMSKMNDCCVNTLRVVSFLGDKGDVQILNVVLKTKACGRVEDDMYTFVNDKGKVFVSALDIKGNIYDKHPVSGVKMKGFCIPHFDKIKPFVCELAKIIPDVRYVGWDIAITDTDVVLIDGSCYPRVYQVKPSISDVKKGDLPKYREYMDV